MGVTEILLLGVALSMDACAVGMTDGMTESKMSVWKVARIAAFFGIFQFLMPLIGYWLTDLIASAFAETFQKISAWLSFLLLAFLGGKMLFEAVKEMRAAKRAVHSETDGAGMRSTEIACADERKKTTGFLTLLVQAVATSIDALAVGVTLQLAANSTGLSLGVWGATGLIGCTTFVLSFGAVYLGKAIGNGLADKAQFVGGLVLIGIGLKILLEGLL